MAVQRLHSPTKRQPDPDTLPDSSDLSGPCPRCGRTSNFVAIGTVPVTFDGRTVNLRDGRGIDSWIEQVTSLRCMGCGQATVVVEEEWVGDHPRREGIQGGGHISWHGIHWWPPPGATDLDEAIPEQLRGGYSEAVRALSATAPRGAVVLLRRTVEGVVRERGSAAAVKALDDKSLAAGLKIMAEEGALDGSLSDWATEIRLTANVGAHFDPIEDVSLNEANDLSRLTRELLKYLYEMPAQLQRARASKTSIP